MSYQKPVFVFCILTVFFSEGIFAENRTIDGTNNNLDNPLWGSTDQNLLRQVPPAYSDGVSSLAGENRKSPREISNIVLDQTEPVFDVFGRSDYLWAWGQFLDHDLDLTLEAVPLEPAYINVPKGDRQFDPGRTGTAKLTFDRAEFDPSTGTDPSNPRQQVNAITSWIDASAVYGDDEDRAEWLRTGTDGKMKTSAGNLLPYNDGTRVNAGGNGTDLFVAGDIRANENAVLTCMQTIFVREHNRLAEQIAAENPTWTDEDIYQRARKIVGAEIQSITYNEFLPALLGDKALSPYSGYDPSIKPDISNVFATAAYRIGHTIVNSNILRLDENFQSIPEGALSLKDAFFNPAVITDNGGIEPLLRGLVYQKCQMIDTKIVGDLRNLLFATTDLASLNMQRGRDHGLPDYNTIREHFGLDPAGTFADITSDVQIQNLLMQAYGTTDDIDPWVGMIAEDYIEGGMIGELNYHIISRQFEYCRDGDRFWYQIDPELQSELFWLNNLTLSQIIQYNTNITGLPSNAFYAVPAPTSLMLAIAGLLLIPTKKLYIK